jgi:adenylate kinase family enzyme
MIPGGILLRSITKASFKSNKKFINEHLSPDKLLNLSDPRPSFIIACDMMQRISVVGTSGSGKTTLAKALAQRLDYAHIELDALHWEPGWQMAPLDLFRTRVAQAVGQPYWVTDGNYSKVRDIVWGRADTVVWFDYPLPLILWRLWWRTLRRTLLRQPLWNENRESFRTTFSRNSVLWWAMATYGRRRREYPELFARPEYARLETVRLRSPRQTLAWLENINNPI